MRFGAVPPEAEKIKRVLAGQAGRQGEGKETAVVFSPYDLSKTTMLFLGVQAKSVLAPPGKA
ncbi:hypothetical protein J7S33_17580, partial [Saccharothrix algeriensis]